MPNFAATCVHQNGTGERPDDLPVPCDNSSMCSLRGYAIRDIDGRAASGCSGSQQRAPSNIVNTSGQNKIARSMKRAMSGQRFRNYPKISEFSAWIKISTKGQVHWQCDVTG